MFIIDPFFIIFVMLPGLGLALWAQWRVKSAFKRGSKIAPRSGITGELAAQAMLDQAGLNDVAIERTQGFLSDHYDPRKKVLRLSPDVHDGRSLAALGVAAHEAGHAIQDAQGYAPLVLRNAVVPMAQFGSMASYFILIGGFLLSMSPLVLAGVVLFAAVVFFQVVNLPCEFNASSRARQQLQQLGLVTGNEDREVGKVLNAAAMTYVAGVVSALLTLLYYVMIYAGMRD